MGPVAPFVPYIIQGAGALGGLFGAKKAGMGGPTGLERGLTQGAMGQAGQLGQMGQQNYAQGTRALGQGASYYSRLLSGDRNTMAQTLQPEITGLTDLARGAERNLSRSGVRGASRDVAEAEIGRQKAGQIGNLFAAARPMAANALTQIGQTSQGQGMSATQGAAGIYGGLLNPAGQQRRDQGQVQGDFGSSIGGMLADVMKGTASKKGKGA